MYQYLLNLLEEWSAFLFVALQYYMKKEHIPFDNFGALGPVLTLCSFLTRYL